MLGRFIRRMTTDTYCAKSCRLALRGWLGDWRVVAALSTIAFVGAVLRFWGLGSISVWGDEYWGHVVGTDAPTVRDYFLQAQLYGTSQAPLHPFLEYLWTRLVGTSSLFLLRAPNVVLSLGIIPLAFAIARRVGGVRAGMVAGLCAALSPLQIWQAQSLRPYSLLVLLAGVSMYAGLRLLDGEGGYWYWWILLANVLGVATHWFYVFFIAAELAAILVLWPEGRRRTLLWGLVHAGWLLPVGVYLLRQPPMNVSFERSFSARRVVEVLLEEAISGFNPRVGPSLMALPGWLHTAGCWALPALFGLALAATPLIVYRGRFVPGSRRRRARPVLFLYAMLLLPVAGLATLEAALDLPFLLPRYVVYGALVRYAAVGLLATAVNARALRGVFLGVLVAALGYQLGIFLPSERTTNYLGALERIRREARPNECVLVDSVAAGYNLAFHAQQGDPPLFFASNLEVVADVALWMLTPHPCATCPQQWPGSVWHVYNLEWGTFDPRQWEQRLTELGLGFTSWEFPAMERLVLYRITWPGATDKDVLFQLRPVPPPPEGMSTAPQDLERMLERMGESVYSVSEIVARIQDGRFFTLGHEDAACLVVLQNGHWGFAEFLAALRAETTPGPESDYLLALVQACRNPSGDNRLALAEAGAQGTPVLRLLLPFTQAFVQGDHTGALRAADALPKFHPYVAKLREVLRRFAQADTPMLPFGLTPVRAEDFDAVASFFAVDCHPCPTGLASADGMLAEVLGLIGRPGEAAALLGVVAEAQPDNPLVEDRLRAYRAQAAQPGSGMGQQGTRGAARSCP